MVCPKIPTKIQITLDPKNQLLSFCLQRSQQHSDHALQDYFKNKNIAEIIHSDYRSLARALNVTGEEEQFFLYMEWDALRCALAKYIGMEDPSIDSDRCFIEEVLHADTGSKISLIILPPQSLPQL